MDAIGLNPAKANGLEDVVLVMSSLTSQVTAMGYVESQLMHHVFPFIHISIAANLKDQEQQIDAQVVTTKSTLVMSTYAAQIALSLTSLTIKANWVIVKQVLNWQCS